MVGAGLIHWQVELSSGLPGPPFLPAAWVADEIISIRVQVLEKALLRHKLWSFPHPPQKKEAMQKGLGERQMCEAQQLDPATDASCCGTLGR